MTDYSVHEPLDGSAAIATVSSRVGTAGCFVTVGSDKPCILSSAHVLAAIPSDKTVFQPPGADGSRAVAKLWDFYGPDPARKDNVLDAAIAVLCDTKYDPRIGALAPPRGFNPNVVANQRVWIHGAGSGRRRSGRIQVVGEPKTVIYDDGSSAGFQGLVRCECYSQAGDSGAAVLDAAGYVVGVHLCGTEDYSWFCRISMVLARWPKIQLITSN
ncbi:trypsin-like peptidase domain-containing protein [Caulobacter segnis]|uniref:Serine protease n=1 Tax=Caulobacter segnis TaxID=88688 RepID=A0A2W5WK64_9CAUL|nr:trypsin-like peptidase domain-containing protein [Caulobacter segnis]PZR34228.1 MAG: hypothetical protein DI526_11005 [Caulobacter segnis]